ncbi:MAG TPA: alanine racemase [Firmicutes bacterium]|nr:alanine racemase [Bacillota bacterium]
MNDAKLGYRCSEWVLRCGLRPTWVEVDLDALTANVRELCRLAGHSQVMAVVKADGYGHGAREVAEAAVNGGARWLAVAALEEGLELRRHGLLVPILVLGYVPPEEATAAVEADISCCVFSLELARALGGAAVRLGKRARVHVKVDTGMGRLGLQPEGAVDFVRSLQAVAGLDVEGVFTHLATADDDLSFAETQLQRFAQVVERLDAEDLRVPYRHAANSAALLHLPAARYNLVRPGLAMYGVHPVPGSESPVQLRPVLTWKTRVGQLKTVAAGDTVGYGRTWQASGGERVATLPVGYADGYRRALSNRGEVLVAGKRAKVVGRVSMDQTTVLLPGDIDYQGSGGQGNRGIPPADEVVLLGRQDGETISAWDMARAANTIPYEILVGIGKRVPRVYLRDGVVVGVRSHFLSCREE